MMTGHRSPVCEKTKAHLPFGIYTSPLWERAVCGPEATLEAVLSRLPGRLADRGEMRIALIGLRIRGAGDGI